MPQTCPKKQKSYDSTKRCLQKMSSNTMEITGENVLTMGLYCKYLRSIVFGKAGYRGCLVMVTGGGSPNLGSTMGQCGLEASEENSLLGSNFLDNGWGNKSFSLSA